MSDYEIKVKPKYIAIYSVRDNKLDSVLIYRFSTQKLEKLNFLSGFFKSNSLVFSDEHIGLQYKIFDINGKEQQVKSQFSTRLVSSFTPAFYRIEHSD